MSSKTSPVGGAPPHQASCCFQKESIWIDVALVTGFLALLAIGNLASAGVLHSIGAANAAYLSYGMYGGAALLLIAEVVKVAINRCKKTNGANSPMRLTHGEIQRLKDRVGPYLECFYRYEDFEPQEVPFVHLYINNLLSHPKFQLDPLGFIIDDTNWPTVSFNDVEKQIHTHTSGTLPHIQVDINLARTFLYETIGKKRCPVRHQA
jgi:hypothetical protein